MFAALASVAGPVLGGMIGANAAGKASEAQQNAANQALMEERSQSNQNRADMAPYRQIGSAAVGRVGDLLGLSRDYEADPQFRQLRDKLIAEQDAAHQAQYGMSIFDARSGLSAAGQRAQFDDMINQKARDEYDRLFPGEPSGELNKKFTVEDFWNDPVTKLGHEFGLSEGTKALDRAFGARGMLKSGAAAKALTKFGTDYTGSKAGESYNRFYGDQDRTFNRLSGVAGTGQTAATNTAAMGNASTGRISDILTSAGNARGAAAIAKGNAFANGLNTVSNFWNQNQMLDKVLNRGGGFGGGQSNADLAAQYNF